MLRLSSSGRRERTHLRLYHRGHSRQRSIATSLPTGARPRPLRREFLGGDDTQAGLGAGGGRNTTAPKLARSGCRFSRRRRRMGDYQAQASAGAFHGHGSAGAAGISTDFSTSPAAQLPLGWPTKCRQLTRNSALSISRSASPEPGGTRRLFSFDDDSDKAAEAHWLSK